jgi:hypothetical protein
LVEDNIGEPACEALTIMGISFDGAGDGCDVVTCGLAPRLGTGRHERGRYHALHHRTDYRAPARLGWHRFGSV